jgi:hypothetical protein
MVRIRFPPAASRVRTWNGLYAHPNANTSEAAATVLKVLLTEQTEAQVLPLWHGSKISGAAIS